MDNVSAPIEIDSEAAGLLKGWGIALLCLGILLCGFALIGMGITVSTPKVTGMPFDVLAIPSDVVNLSKVHHRELVFHSGLASLVAGVVLLAAGVVAAAIERVLPSSTIAPVESSGRASSPVQGEGFTPAAAAAPSHVTTEEDNASFFWTAGIGATVVIIFLILWLAATPSSKTKEASSIEANAEMMADNMEMEADRLDAMADNAAIGR